MTIFPLPLIFIQFSQISQLLITSFTKRNLKDQFFFCRSHWNSLFNIRILIFLVLQLIHLSYIFVLTFSVWPDFEDYWVFGISELLPSTPGVSPHFILSRDCCEIDVPFTSGVWIIRIAEPPGLFIVHFLDKWLNHLFSFWFLWTLFVVIVRPEPSTFISLLSSSS